MVLSIKIPSRTNIAEVGLPGNIIEPVEEPCRCWGPERSTNYGDRPTGFLLNNFAVRPRTCYLIVGPTVVET